LAALGLYLKGDPGAVVGGLVGSGAKEMPSNISKTPWGQKWLRNQMNQPYNQALAYVLIFTGARNAIAGVTVDQDQE